MINKNKPAKAESERTKQELFIKNQYIKSIGKEMTLYTGVMTRECAEVTLESFKSGFPMYEHTKHILS